MIKRFLFRLAVLILIPFFSACNFLANPENHDSTLLGTWVEKTRVDDHVVVFKRADKFAQDAPGLAFKTNGDLVQRQNAGWCGTPPIAYTNYKGKWEHIEDNKIEVESKYWGGTLKFRMKIVSVDQFTLRARIQYLNSNH